MASGLTSHASKRDLLEKPQTNGLWWWAAGRGPHPGGHGSSTPTPHPTPTLHLSPPLFLSGVFSNKQVY